MPDFTKGKWVDCPDYTVGVLEDDGSISTFICDLSDPFMDEAEQAANARLVAAAPEMYDWLGALLCYVYEANALTTNAGAKKETAQDIAQVEALLARIDGKGDTRGGEEKC